MQGPEAATSLNILPALYQSDSKQINIALSIVFSLHKQAKLRRILLENY